MKKFGLLEFKITLFVLLLSLAVFVFFIFPFTTAKADNEEETGTSTEIIIDQENASTTDTSTSTETILNDTPTSSTNIDIENQTKSKENTLTKEEVDRAAALSESKQKRILNLAANISNRLDAVIARQENIAKRLDSRSKKMNEAGLDTSLADLELKETNQTIQETKDLMSNIDKMVYQAVTALEPKKEWPEVKNTYLETEKLINQTQNELKNVIYLLKNPNSSAEILETDEIDEIVPVDSFDFE